MQNKYNHPDLPKPAKQGLYDPSFEHDACGVGMVANIEGIKSHEIVDQGLEALCNLGHRGATGADPETGDGAGILVQMPHEFFALELEHMGSILPDIGDYGVGMAFLPSENTEFEKCMKTIQSCVESEGMSLLTWREVPIDPSKIGVLANEDFEFALYALRRKIEKSVENLFLSQAEDFYICSLSCNKIVYKGLVMAHQLQEFYLDLANNNFRSSFALVHSRFSTNTLGSWKLAHPYRYVIHNGEINTHR